MGLSALVISHGSIGKRHAEILTQLEDISNVSVLSSQNSLPYRTLKSMEEIPSFAKDSRTCTGDSILFSSLTGKY